MIYRAIFLFAIGLSLIGCGGSEPEKPVVKDVTSTANVDNAARPLPGPEGNTNANVEQIHPKSIAGRANKREIVDSGPMPDLKPNFSAAPENSESAATMNSKGQVVETRVFKGHPQLAKAEAVWIDGKKKEVTVTLKNGRSVKKTTDSLENLKTASTDFLLEIAGFGSIGQKPSAAPANLERR